MLSVLLDSASYFHDALKRESQRRRDARADRLERRARAVSSVSMAVSAVLMVVAAAALAVHALRGPPKD